MDYRSAVTVLAILLIGFGVGYLAKPTTQVQREVYHVPTTITLATTATHTLRQTITETLTSVVTLKPEIYIYELPENLRVKVIPEGVLGILRLKIYVTNTGNSTISNIYVLALGYSYFFGSMVRYTYIDMVEPGLTRLATVDFDLGCSKYYISIIVVD